MNAAPADADGRAGDRVFGGGAAQASDCLAVVLELIQGQSFVAGLDANRNQQPRVAFHRYWANG